MKLFKNLLLTSLLLCCAYFMSCTSVTAQSKKSTVMDVSQEDTIGGTGTSSADVRSMAERMAREISGIKWPKKLDKVRIVLQDPENQTRFSFNPNVIKDRLLADLVDFSLNTNLSFTEKSFGANYTLATRITALSKGSSEGVSDYLLYSFKLLDHDGTVVWMRTYETKKQGQVGVMYR